MQGDPLVSIRCLVYNHEPFLRQCLDGFVMQQTTFPFEAIIHDDASTDGSAAIIREYAEKYPDIIKPIYETENQYSKRDGSLRRIMDAAMHPSAKYIAICEGDDYWIDPLKLQKQVDFLESHKDYMMACCRSMQYSMLTDSFVKDQACYEESKTVEVEDVIMLGGAFIPTCSIVYRSFVAGDYPEYCRQCHVGDWPLQLLCAIRGKVYYFNNAMCVYRIENKNSWTGQSHHISFQNKLAGIYSEVIMLNGLIHDNSCYNSILVKKRNRIIILNVPIKLLQYTEYRHYKEVFKDETKSFSHYERKQFLKNSSIIWVKIIRKMLLRLCSHNIF